MDKQLIATTSITIKATPAAVWDALVNPEKISQYLYGTHTESDWQVGSPIYFRGEWEGKAYEDKGKILAFDSAHKLQYTYLSSFSGLDDQPENYSVVTFELSPEGEQTRLTVTQDNFKDEAQRAHTQTSWEDILGGLKKLVEQTIA